MKIGSWLTDKEILVYNVIKQTMDFYGDGFSDVTFIDIVKQTGLDEYTVKGVLGSLIKKGIVEDMDVNGEFNIYYIKDYES